MLTKNWEQRELKCLVSFKSNGVDKKINLNDKKVNLLNYMDVYNHIDLNSKNCTQLMQVSATERQIRENSVMKNDIFITPSSESPEDIARVLVIKENLPNTVYSYHLVRLRPYDNSFHSIFPNYCLSSFKVRRQFILSAQGVQRFVLNKKAFEEIELSLPNLSEQAKIGTFFEKIDNLITLHQCK